MCDGFVLLISEHPRQGHQAHPARQVFEVEDAAGGLKLLSRDDDEEGDAQLQSITGWYP